MIMIKYFLFNFSSFCVIVSIFDKTISISVLNRINFFLANSSYTVFLPTLFFTKSLSLLKSAGVVSNLPISNLSISDF